MANQKSEEKFEIEQDMDFQQKEWRASRAGWVVMALVALAALAGLFGAGPLSKDEASDGALRVEHQRILRYLAPAVLEVHLTPAELQDGKASFWLDRAYLDTFLVERIQPEPDSTQLLPDRVVYEFQTEEAGQPLRVTFKLQTERLGTLQARIGEDSSGSLVQFQQIVLP